MKRRILVVEDENSVRRAFTRYLEGQGYTVEGAESAEVALNRIAAFDPELIITDNLMPGMNGLQLLQRIREVRPETYVVVVTGDEDTQTAVDAVKGGAYDFLAKPLDLEELRTVVERAFHDLALRGAAVDPPPEPGGGRGLERLVGRDARMIAVYKMIGTVAQNSAAVLVRGESGTGKELVARAIHYNSARAAEPFVAVNCTALAETLLESELFGHVKGAFTGAVSDRKGRFEAAGRGTIFLDEIGDTTPAFQAKLLRVLQDGSYYPVGGEQPQTTGARVIAATHRDLEEQVREVAFREDLYFRLQVVEIVIPPLRERPGDIPRLAKHLLARIGREMHKEVHIIPDEVMRRLVEYSWPGNVRELENTLTRAVVLARGPAITEEGIALAGPGVLTRMGEDAPADDTLDAVESAHVQKILRRMEGNKRRSARVLGISRPRLDRLIAKYDLDVG